MSDSTGLALSIATTIFGAFLFMYIQKLTADKGAEIATGLVRGHPLPTRYRRLMLYQYWVPYQAGGFAVGAGVALANMTIARFVTDASAKTFVEMLAFATLFAAVPAVVGGAIVFLELHSLLRQAD